MPANWPEEDTSDWLFSCGIPQADIFGVLEIINAWQECGQGALCQPGRSHFASNEPINGDVPQTQSAWPARFEIFSLI
jgi:hypothetical protein